MKTSFTTFLKEKNIKKVEDEKTEVSKDTKDVSNEKEDDVDAEKDSE